jgi:hypothetical protein
MSTKDLSMMIGSIDVSTRAKRRQATSFAIDLLEHIRAAEEANIDRFPVNFQDGYAYANAGDSLEVITDAIAELESAYD